MELKEDWALEKREEPAEVGGNCDDGRECTINILTKFHKDWIKTVTSTVYTNKLMTDTRMHTQLTPDITRSHKNALRDPVNFSRTDGQTVQLLYATLPGA
ncbi:hypothetical protein DPMN_088966 [Dreissena polymorpha]|uniref:Uncharacterized protein n=1 Tax=Dreissena polymorpha TaxID=45954 RepID=A0A9D4KW20_DREPO|nr:hypothetical protein DPMN_088966 [Dreissena polymorpha]